MELYYDARSDGINHFIEYWVHNGMAPITKYICLFNSARKDLIIIMMIIIIIIVICPKINIYVFRLIIIMLRRVGA